MLRLADFTVGQTAEVSCLISEAMVDEFARLSGDSNPVHMSAETARALGFPQRVVHGCLTLSLLSTLIGTRLPGEGALWRTVEVDWTRPVFPGDQVVVRGEVVQKSIAAESLVIKAEARNQAGTVVFRATATVGLLASAEQKPHAAPSAADVAAQPSRVGSGKVVLVTGASRGIGRAIALALGRGGHPVAIGFHRAGAEAASVAAEINAEGGAAVTIQLDVTASRFDLSKLEQSLGTPTALVHAATPPLMLKKIGEPGFDENLEAYLAAYVRAPLALTRMLEASMTAARWGRVVLIGTSALLGAPPAKMTAYVTGKSAMLGLARSLAVELGPAGVTVNVVSPGLTATDLTRDVSPRAQLAEAQRTPLRRIATPSDTAGVVTFLFSEAGSFVTGAHLPVSGGLTMA
jgi:3-oxoacyl-[acyl-carrier protein] reductase